MKNKFKNIAKLGILLFGISVTIMSCQKDDQANAPIQHQGKEILKVRTLKNNEISINTKLVSKLQTILSVKDTKQISGVQNREVYNSQYDFYIDTDIANYIENDIGHSYTFPIYRAVQNTLTENLLLALQEDGSYKAFLIAYNFTDIQKEQVDNFKPIIGDYQMDITVLNEALSGDILGKMVYEDGCYINRTEYHTNQDGTWQYNGTCPHEKDGDYDYCHYYTIDSIITCTTSSGGESTGNTTTGPNGETHGGNTSTTNNTSAITCKYCPTLDEEPECQEALTGSLTALTLTPDEECWLINHNSVKVQFENYVSLGLDYYLSAQAAISLLQNGTATTFEEAMEIVAWENFVLYTEDFGSDVITDIIDYMRCFDLTQNADITIYVDQPKSNSSDPYRITYNPFDPVDVGHTFIKITQGGITRVLGFYPTPNVVDPYNGVNSTSSLLINDSAHDYDVSISTNISASQLTDIYNQITTSNSTYNCTDFGIAIGNSALLNLADTSGSWPYGGNGSNPGNLGQDVRNMSLPPGATRSTNAGQSDSNSGTRP